MNTYQKELIEEHAQLLIRVQKLHNCIYIENNQDNKVEFANKCIQLASMKKYLECLEARMCNVGIYFEDGTYTEKVAEIRKQPIVVQVAAPVHGSDYDVDKKILKKHKKKHKHRHGRK